MMYRKNNPNTNPKPSIQPTVKQSSDKNFKEHMQHIINNVTVGKLATSKYCQWCRMEQTFVDDKCCLCFPLARRK